MNAAPEAQPLAGGAYPRLVLLGVPAALLAALFRSLVHEPGMVVEVDPRPAE